MEHNAAAQLVHNYGYWGLAVGLLLNCMGIPIAAEVILPLTGALIRSGGLDAVWVCSVAVAAQVLGFIIAYLLARHGGMDLLDKYGHLAFLNKKQLRKLHKAFASNGFRMVLVGMYLPAVHGYMGYVAGLGKLRFPVFLLLAVSSTTVWTIVLVALGMLLSDHLGSITQAMSGLGIATVVVLVLVGLGFWYHKQHAK